MRQLLRGFKVLIHIIIFVYFSSAVAAPPSGKGNSKPASDSGSSVDPYTPMTITKESYDFRYSTRQYCMGEDDNIQWEAFGDLQPGESFSFTPLYPACINHSAVVSVMASWEGSNLELSSNVPLNTAGDHDGQLIVAPNVGSSAQLCMFPNYGTENTNYTITIKNVGTSLAKNVRLNGLNHNSWAILFYKRCLNADADHDGWNDSLEFSIMSQMTGIGYIDGELQFYVLYGSNYLADKSLTPTIDDEIDNYPVDFNDDGVVDQLDVDRITAMVGEGNGVPLEQISPNPGDGIYYFWSNMRAFRRFDIEGDGYVTQKDVDIVKAHVGHPVPMSTDIIAPTAKVLLPSASTTVYKGSYFLIEGHVWDNSSIAKVEYLVNGKVICSVTEPSLPNSIFANSPFYNCWWQVPKKRGDYQLEIRVTDGSGNITTSETATVTPQ